MSFYHCNVGRNARLNSIKGEKTVNMSVGKAKKIGDGSITAIQDNPEAIAFCTDRCPFPGSPNRCGNCREFKEFARDLIRKQKNT